MIGSNKFIKSTFSFLILILALMTSINAISYNDGGDFTLSIPKLKQTTENDNIKANFIITIKNNLDSNQNFKLDLKEVSGWNIIADKDEFFLPSGEETQIKLNLVANSDFKYEQSVVGPNEIVISQKENYIGTFDFPITVIGDNENMSIKFTVDIKPKEILEIIYNINIATDSVSPINPLGYSVRAENLEENQNITITTNIGNEEFEIKDTFNEKNDYKVYQQEIPTSIEPGTYNVKITLRVIEGKKILEWSEDESVVVDIYENIISDENSKKTFFIDRYFITVTNDGNTKNVFEKDIEINTISSFLFNTNLKKEEYTNTDNGIKISLPLEKGESKTIELEFNYIIIYIILLVIIIISSYIYIRKNSNPMDVETKIYEIRKVKHEGIKSMKIRIGFENIKEKEIEKMSLNFKMPSYLKVKDNSFLLTEPNKILKGSNQYKLIWDFKRLEKNDSRILGFSVINARGILGDIKIPNLELEIKSKGKIRKYYKSFPTIKG